MRVRLVLFIGAFVLALQATPALAHTTYQVKRAIHAEVHRAGWGQADVTAAIILARRESTWRDTARNHRYLGVFQLNRTMCEWFDWRNPYLNSRRAMRYIRHRYGSPRRALAHSYRYGWY